MATRSRMRLLIGNILRLLISFLVFTFFSFSNCFAKTTLESLPSHGEQSVIHAIESAHHTIQITMYGFTDKKIAATLINKKLHGVQVQLLIEHEPFNAISENSQILRQLINTGIAIHYNSTQFSLTHQKTILIDQQYAMILTGNFTYSGFYRQRNFIVTTDEPNIVDNLKKLFEADWNHAQLSLPQDSSFVISPENSWPVLNTLITNSQKTLDIYALELTDKRIIRAFLHKKAHIRIMTSLSTKIANQNNLCEHHIEIHRLQHLDQHAKTLLSDYHQPNAVAYVGSANLTYYSLSKNREVGMLFSDKIALDTLHNTFEKDWKKSHSICKTLHRNSS